MILNGALNNVNNLANKVLYVHNFCIFHCINIFAIIETWLQPHVSDSILCFQNYSIFRNDYNSGRAKHGFAIYIKNTLNTTLYTD